MTERAQRRLAAVVAADVAGYSRLVGQDEEGTLAALRAHRKQLIDPLLAERGGRVANTAGDSLLIEFASVVDAVRFALAMQRSVAALQENVADADKLLFRIGIHLGDVVVDGEDLLGDGVNVAARLEQLADPGTVLVSDDAYRQLRGKLDIGAEDIGEKRLKNIAHPIRVYRLDANGSAAGKVRPRARRQARTLRVRVAVGLVAVLLSALSIAALIGLFETGTHESRSADVSPADVVARTNPSIPIIAVLPFVNRTGDPQEDYFAAGVTDDLITAIGRFKTIRVLSHNAVLPFGSKSFDRGEIVAKLGASYVLEGNVMRANHKIRISIQLSNSESSTVLWTNRYEGEVENLFQVQDEIVRHIAGALAVNVTHLEAMQHRDRPRPDLAAYDLMLQARAIGYSASRSANRKFRELMAAALERDASFAAAYALRSEALNIQAIQGWTQFPDRALAEAEQDARKAIALAPDEADGHRALGRVLVVRRDYEGATRELKRALEINPSDAYALAVWGDVQVFTGDIPASVAALELALRLDPRLDAVYVFDLTLSYYLMRRHEDALRLAQEGLARFPEFAVFNLTAAAAAAQLGRRDDAKRFVDDIHARLPFLDLDAIGSRFRDKAYPDYLKRGLELAGL